MAGAMVVFRFLQGAEDHHFRQIRGKPAEHREKDEDGRIGNQIAADRKNARQPARHGNDDDLGNQVTG